HLQSQLDRQRYYRHLEMLTPPSGPGNPVGELHSNRYVNTDYPNFDQLGLILVVVMPGGETPELLTTILAIAKQLQWPILCDALSSLRNYADGTTVIVTYYDFILRSSSWGQALIPEQILQIGELPTSKELRSWLGNHHPLRYILNFPGENLDPLHSQTVSLPVTVDDVLQFLKQTPNLSSPRQLNYTQTWQDRQQQAAQIIQSYLADSPWNAPGLVAQLPHLLPPQTSIFVANSLPIRWLEFFWPTNGDRHHLYVNRGANGIDGTLSTAMGIAHQAPGQTLLLTGDLSLLHDSNGFLNQSQLQGRLTIILFNNHGGGIFEGLAIAAHDDVFERYFATPQAVDFAQLCQTYGVHHQTIPDLLRLKTALDHPAPTPIQVLELTGDRRAEWQWLTSLQTKFID
ncbi:MAG: thiamine pyrophosphate-dependent enzyme, partial [Synechocystis sp.]